MSQSRLKTLEEAVDLVLSARDGHTEDLEGALDNLANVRSRKRGKPSRIEPHADLVRSMRESGATLAAIAAAISEISPIPVHESMVQKWLKSQQIDQSK